MAELFAPVGAAYLAGRRIKAFMGFRFVWNPGIDETVGPEYFFLGQGVLVSGGQTWYGGGRLVSVSDIEQGLKLEAPKTTFTVSGVDSDIVTETLLLEPSIYYNQPVFGYYLYFDANDAGYVALGSPLLFWTNTMKSLSVSDELGKSTISIETEGPFFKRKRPIHGTLSDVDQQFRFPGDLGCDGMSLLTDKTVTWPYFEDPAP